jgi:hypothetical protein
VTYAADLSVYRSQILAVITQPDCNDGLDEDGDGAIDFPEDPGCSSLDDDSELDASLACDNGLDDDADGWIDFPEDWGCTDLIDPSEVPEPGVAIGLLVGMGALGLLKGRRRLVSA